MPLRPTQTFQFRDDPKRGQRPGTDSRKLRELSREGLPGMHSRGHAAAPVPRRKSLDSRLREQPSRSSFVAVKASVVAPHQHERTDQPVAPVGERALKAAAFVFRACNTTRTGVLSRWEFASAVEMMMRQKLVPYLIDQVDAARLDAEFAEAAQGDDECGPETFSRWFEKFDAYLLNFYPEVQPPPREGNKRIGRYEQRGSERKSRVGSSSSRRRSSLLGRGAGAIAHAVGAGPSSSSGSGASGRSHGPAPGRSPPLLMHGTQPPSRAVNFQSQTDDMMSA